jgi:hypothetical protein
MLQAGVVGWSVHQSGYGTITSQQKLAAHFKGGGDDTTLLHIHLYESLPE